MTPVHERHYYCPKTGALLGVILVRQATVIHQTEWCPHCEERHTFRLEPLVLWDGKHEART